MTLKPLHQSLDLRPLCASARRLCRGIVFRINCSVSYSWRLTSDRLRVVSAAPSALHSMSQSEISTIQVIFLPGPAQRFHFPQAEPVLSRQDGGCNP